MTGLTAFLVRWNQRHPDRYRERLLETLGRLPDAEDVAEAERVLARKRAER